MPLLSRVPRGSPHLPFCFQAPTTPLKSPRRRSPGAPFPLWKTPSSPLLPPHPGVDPKALSLHRPHALSRRRQTLVLPPRTQDQNHPLQGDTLPPSRFATPQCSGNPPKTSARMKLSLPEPPSPAAAFMSVSKGCVCACVQPLVRAPREDCAFSLCPLHLAQSRCTAPCFLCVSGPKAGSSWVTHTTPGCQLCGELQHQQSGARRGRKGTPSQPLPSAAPLPSLRSSWPGLAGQPG